MSRTLLLYSADFQPPPIQTKLPQSVLNKIIQNPSAGKQRSFRAAEPLQGAPRVSRYLVAALLEQLAYARGLREEIRHCLLHYCI